MEKFKSTATEGWKTEFGLMLSKRDAADLVVDLTEFLHKINDDEVIAFGLPLQNPEGGLMTVCRDENDTIKTFTIIEEEP